LTVIRVGFRIASTCVCASRGLVWAVSGPQGGSGVAPKWVPGCYAFIFGLPWLLWGCYEVDMGWAMPSTINNGQTNPSRAVLGQPSCC
jgi:hypothetical protein